MRQGGLLLFPLSPLDVRFSFLLFMSRLILINPLWPRCIVVVGVRISAAASAGGIQRTDWFGDSHTTHKRVRARRYDVPKVYP